MTGSTLYRDMDQAALDAAYDNRRKVPGFDFQAFLDKCEARNSAARDAHDCLLDIPFGPSADEKLDIFRPRSGHPVPVHVFFHGGYWRALNKADFSYVANGIVPNGQLLVVVNYSLMPTVRMAELVAQCRRSLDWVSRNIARYGGNPDCVSISGHSAGGHLTAMMLAEPWQSGPAGAPFTRACAISGIYDLEPIRLCFLNKELGLNEQEAALNSPVRLDRHVRDVPLSVLVGHGEGEEYVRQAEEFAAAWCLPDAPVAVHAFPEHDHFSIRFALNDPASPVTRLALGL